MKERAEKFVVEWLKNNIDANVLDAVFIDEFVNATGCTFSVTTLGANKCNYAGRTLSRMFGENTLKRFAVGLGSNYQAGFPKWVYSYTLNVYHPA